MNIDKLKNLLAAATDETSNWPHGKRDNAKYHLLTVMPELIACIEAAERFLAVSSSRDLRESLDKALTTLEKRLGQV